MRPARHRPTTRIRTHSIFTLSTSSEDIIMNTQKTIAAATPARFDLRSTGLTDAQLKAIAGARMADKTGSVTVAGVTKCCWG
jgi:hypothetical protein